MFEAKNAVFLIVNGIGLLGTMSAIVVAFVKSFRKGFLTQFCSALLMFLMVVTVYLLSDNRLIVSIIQSANYTLLYVAASLALFLGVFVARVILFSVSQFLLRFLRLILGPLDDLLCFAWMVFTKKPAASNQNQGSSANAAGASWKRDVRLLLEALVIWHTPAVARWLVGALPSANVITNILDLVSLVLATPKLFTRQIKDFLLQSRFQIARLFVIVLLPYVSFRVMTYMDAPLLSAFTEFSKAYPDPIGRYASEYMSSKLEEIQFFSIWVSGFAFNVTLVSLVFLLCVIVLNYKVSQGNEEKLADTALVLSLIVFGYSRAISMLA